MKRNLLSWQLLRRFPRRRHLKGTILHRATGERLFDPQLWRPNRNGIAGGLAVGTFIALTPTIGVQMVLATMAAYLLRVNIPTALVACWITNPLTAPVIYLLQYQLGQWLAVTPTVEELAEYQGFLKNFVRHARPLWVGSLVSATFSAGLAYSIVYFGWAWIAKLGARLFPRLQRRLQRLKSRRALAARAGSGRSARDTRLKGMLKQKAE